MMKRPTAFEERLYELLLCIPRGKVVTYATLAEMMGNRGYARAVGNALHKNPDGEKYPCYKVVNAKGALAPTFVFGGIDEQKRRLEAEGIEVKDGYVDLEKYGYNLF
ncbi:MAG: MGMT family protein [Clostridia bacterium]|nr:MGMT family protein [Clostridia bacterium]